MDESPIDFSPLALPAESFERMVRAVVTGAAAPAKSLRAEPRPSPWNGHAAVSRPDAAVVAPEKSAPAVARKWRKRGWVLAAALALLGVAFAAFTAWQVTSSGSGAVDGEASVASETKKKPHVEPHFDPRAWTSLDSSLKDMAVPGGTPALEPAPTDADGHLDVEVLADGVPKPGAEVRLYWRGAVDPSGLSFEWRLAGGGVTDAKGHAHIAAGPGAYVLAVRGQGFAISHRDVSRPSAEALTRVKLELDRGSVLKGRVVEARSGAEVPLASLTLSPVAPSSAMLIPASSPPEETLFATADARGRFEIPQVETGEYRLVAAAPGHARATKQLFLPRGGEEVVTLPSAANLEGFVVDAHGAPAAGAEVTVRYVMLAGSHDIDELAQTTSGPQGGFAVEVSPGRCTLTARLGNATGAAAEPVVVSVGQTVRGITLRLGASGAIEGTVTAKDTHAPVDGASVVLSPSRGVGELGRATTAGGGHFAVEGLAAGSYDLEVRAEGYPALSRNAVTLAAGQRFPMSLELEATASAVGTVRDAAGNPVPNAVVAAGALFGGPLGSGGASQVRTGEDGSWVLRGLGAGPVRLTAGREPGVPLAVQTARLESGKETRVELVLRETGIISGRVTSKSGAALKTDAVVRAMPRDGPMPTPADVRVAPVGADGRYTMELPAGQYSLRAYLADADSLFSPPTGPAVAVTAGQSGQADLTLDDDAPVLSGTVLEPDGSPSALAWVRISAAGQPLRMLRTDETGQFQVEASEPGGLLPELPDSVDVVARNGGRVGRSLGVAKGTSQVTVQLSPGGGIHGTVTGAPAPDTVHALATPVDESLWFMFGGDGPEFLGTSFDSSDVPAGAARVTVTASDGRSGTAEVNVPAGGTAEVMIDLQGTASVSGRLVGPTGQPAVGAMVGVDTASPRPVAPDGSFALGGLADGKHVLRALATGTAMLSKPLTLTAGQTVDVGTLTLAPPPKH